ncbi:cytochrome c biogenesis protein [Capnocytophaga sp.]|uniref:cytochrome c biogenesis protein n=1 Tax=Capnocytophaga sp. TaxID=44737 RepID=UPI0026DCD203|nr:cytochrome c biogenesis protein CcsA [Capnocytophaga sp.]MDO5105466.1 cytochrome c biogenesis protein CcsA [Capnocytophaga sp.]
MKFIFSTRLMAVLFVVYAVSLGLGTFIENDYGIDTARIWIYNAWWFELIMFLFMVNFIGNIKRYSLLKKENWAVLVLHLSWVFIIFGAFITRYVSDEGLISIREGETADFYVSDRTYVTVFVDGQHDSEALRKSNQTEVLFSPHTNNNYRWASDFKGKDFEVNYKKFVRGVQEGFVTDANGEMHLKLVESSMGERHEHYLKDGDISNIHNILFAVNRPTEGAINLIISEEGYFIKTPFEGNYMTMATQERTSVLKDSLQPLHLRSLYTLGDTQFVVPEPMVRGKQGVIQLPEKEVTRESANAVVFEVKSGSETQEVMVMGRKGSVESPKTVTVNGLDFHISYGSRRVPIPFAITLNDFIADKYPGTENSYSAFKSKVTVASKEDKFDYEIYMNNILNYKGYRLFQAQFHPDEKGSVISVNHDYWGTLFTYIGYFLLYGGLIAFMFVGNSRFVKLAKQLKGLQLKRAATLLALLMVVPAAFAQHSMRPTEKQLDSILKVTTVSKQHAERFGELVIQDAGRMKPVHTFASELLRKMSKNDTFRDMNANQVLLSMMLNPMAWYYVDLMSVKKQNDSLHAILGVEKGKKYVSAVDFYDEKMNYKLAPFLQEAYATNTPNQFQKDFKQADERMGLLNRALSGEILRIFPLLDDANNKWVSTLEFRENPKMVSDTLYANFINGAVPIYLNMLRQAIQTGDYTNPDKLLDAFKTNQQNHGGAVLPSESKIKAEILYNKAHIFNRLFQWYLYVGTLMFVLLIVDIFSRSKVVKNIIKVCKYLIFVLFILHTLGLIGRWYISGHAPWSDAYESMIYVAWATMGIGLVFAKRSPLSLASTAFVTSMILMIAHWNWMDPSIGTLQPVLNSYWLMIHVAVIVGSYGPFALGAILGIVCMFLMIFTTQKNKKKLAPAIQELVIVGELALTVGLVMLTIGNFLGGMWANESWGRYWGWDPKETWALVSIMVYAFVIHMRLVPGLRGKWAFSFAATGAFFSIMMTYFGVNFYLSGLHSYASGDKIITPSFVYYSVAFVLILGAVSYWKYRVYYKK